MGRALLFLETFTVLLLAQHRGVCLMGTSDYQTPYLDSRRMLSSSIHRPTTVLYNGNPDAGLLTFTSLCPARLAYGARTTRDW